MSRCDKSDTRPASAARSKSPLATAIAISFAIASGAVLGTVDSSTFDEITSGKWLTRPFEETQQRNTATIATLDSKVGGIVKDIDFIASRVSASIRRNEDQAADRLSRLDAEIAELRERFASMQAVHLAPRASDALLGNVEPARPADENGEISGLRSSLHELANAHEGAVAAITKRLDRIEVMVGLSTDVTSSVADPLQQQKARRATFAAKPARKHATPAAAPQVETTAERSAPRPERGHIFNIKPASQQTAPLRLSRLPG